MTKGERTRARVVECATSRARTAGLDGITLGTLAAELSVSKSGLYAHFRSKQQLQLAVLDRAVEQFRAEVIGPAMQQGEGVPRLWELFRRYLKWAHREGGCPFIAFSAEMDDRPGPLRDRLADLTRGWLRRVRDIVADAAARGHLRADVDPSRFAFEFHSILVGAHMALRLLDDRRATRFAKAALEDLLERATPRRRTDPYARTDNEHAREHRADARRVRRDRAP